MAKEEIKTPYSILYEKDGTIFQCGPWNTEAEALAWAQAHNYPKEDNEFDINDQRVYILHPTHRLEELSIADVEGAEDDITEETKWDEDRGNVRDGE